jgi:hypothetical protein
VKIYLLKKKVKRDKCIPLGIKNDNVPPKFVITIENTTLKDQNSYKNELKILNSNKYGTYGNKGDS